MIYYNWEQIESRLWFFIHKTAFIIEGMTICTLLFSCVQQICSWRATGGKLSLLRKLNSKGREFSFKQPLSLGKLQKPCFNAFTKQSMTFNCTHTFVQTIIFRYICDFRIYAEIPHSQNTSGMGTNSRLTVNILFEHRAVEGKRLWKAVTEINVFCI